MSDQNAATTTSSMKTRPPSREAETREATQRTQSWTPPSQFPIPPPQPGIVFHWIRTALRGVPDVGNVNKRFSEGWRPLLATDYPQFQILHDSQTRFPDNIEINGLLLCWNTEEVMRQRKQYYQQRTLRQMETVDNSMFKMQDKRVPMFRQRSSRVTVGRRPDAETKE